MPIILCKFKHIQNTNSYICTECSLLIENVKLLPIYSICKKYHTFDSSDTQKQINKTNCVYKSQEHIRTEQCQSCQGDVQIKIFECKIHKECTLSKLFPNIACCVSCHDYKE